ncbi:GNAT family N-acetyltransferase [Sphingorhabdus sp. Alg239-R122]|uniref:GNAT family N-acetyltransferase n=1 Tax=Sphingorhabdus sp. Alg239-R122 TaxID=2305989 RepID=UPI0013DA7F0A|nr:GNAT family N-acetyltransferase [Sphingorhabdus sp. Alg239-R122]
MTDIPVPDGHIASVVTHLEMCARPKMAAIQSDALVLERWERPGLAEYRALFRRVGAPWLWFSRLVMDDAVLGEAIHDPGVHIYAIRMQDGADAGILELDFRQDGACEVGFLGLVPEQLGKGHGRWLMTQALQQAWGHPGVERVWLHTCSFDHLGALKFYQRSGFQPFRREVEIVPDPRLAGYVPRDAAPHVPIIGGE